MTPVFKTGNLKQISNYRPISALPCFRKMLERIMHNLFIATSLTKKNIFEAVLLKKKSHPTENVIAQLTDQIHELFENDNYTYTWGFYQFKAFDTIDHAILLKRREDYGIKGANLPRFRSCLTNRK